MDSTAILEWEKQTAVMVCNIDANPAPSDITWVHNGVPVIQDATHLMLSENSQTRASLVFTTLTKDDKGEYYCKVTNDVATQVGEVITIEVLRKLVV